MLALGRDLVRRGAEEGVVFSFNASQCVFVEGHERQRQGIWPLQSADAPEPERHLSDSFAGCRGSAAVLPHHLKLHAVGLPVDEQARLGSAPIACRQRLRHGSLQIDVAQVFPRVIHIHLQLHADSFVAGVKS